MRQHLFIDADDTLWNNNIYFERAIHAFITFLNHSQLSPVEVRQVIDEGLKLMGSGVANFTRSLLETYRRLAERNPRDEEIEQVRQFGLQVAWHPIHLIEGVQETLTYLSGRHDLFLLTKGNRDEQEPKVERSGVKDFFREVVVVQEKDVITYHHLIEQFRLVPGESWMIGNSPRSDINPALAAGLNAVFIPHNDTWHMALEELNAVWEGQLLTLTRFTELCDHF
jgi:putative hydrolase of the HAD superfamily